MFDPCGTRRLDGEDIIARLATTLGVPPARLRNILLDLVIYYEVHRVTMTSQSHNAGPEHCCPECTPKRELQ